MPKHVSLRSQAGDAVVGVIVLVVVVAVVGLIAWRVHDRRTNKTASTTTATQPTNAASQTSKGLSGGTDDASLSSDMNNINASLGEGDRNLQSATTAVGDEQQSISVPTN